MNEMKNQTTVDPEEAARFSALAAQWWNPDGPMRPLHLLNPVRLDYLQSVIRKHEENSGKLSGNPAERPFAGIKLLDIGCAAGLVSEPLARLGAEVTGIDASASLIAAAQAHIANDGSKLSLDYQTGEVADLLEKNMLFDVVLALEIVEHVTDPAAFLAQATACLKPGGLLVVSTLNRTLKSFVLGIVGAEYVLRWLPRGTHSWKKFLQPGEIINFLAPHNMQPQGITGLVFDPLRWRFFLKENDVDVNYYMCFRKMCFDGEEQ